MIVYVVTKYFQKWDNSSIHIQRGKNGYYWEEDVYGYPNIFLKKENIFKWFETLGTVKCTDNEYFVDGFKYIINEIKTFDDL